MKTIPKQILEAQGFFNHTLWADDLTTLPKGKRHLYYCLRVIYASVQDFTKKRGNLRATALTYFTMLSLIPVIAMAFGIAKGFGLREVLEHQLKEQLQGHETVHNYLVDFVDSTLSTTNGGFISGMGLIFLIYTVVKLLMNIEIAFNHIWEVKKQRPLLRKITDYFTLMFLGPIVIIVTTSASLFVSSHVKQITEKVSQFDEFNQIFFQFIDTASPLILGLLLTLLYWLMPNKKVPVKNALIGGFIASYSIQIIQLVYVEFQIGVSNFNAIYGSFAALPLFLVFLQTSWVIVIFGNIIAHTISNLNSYNYSIDLKYLSENQREIISILLLDIIIKGFKDEQELPYSKEDLSKISGIPYKVVQQSISNLCSVGLVAGTKIHEDQPQGYLPAVSLDNLTYEKTIARLRNHHTKDLNIEKSEAYLTIEKYLEEKNIVLK